MAEDDDLRINTLHRFAKRSQSLVLHEYSHCEVPAGCGGVVLRWIDPQQGSPATFRLATASARGRLWLDGVELASSLSLLRAGRRVIAIHLRRGTQRSPGAEPFTLSVTYDAAGDDELIRAARWRCTAAPPPEAWTSPELDDRDWGLVPFASPDVVAAQEDWVRRAFEYRAGRGEPIFALEPDELWLRVAFTAPEAPR
jgi:hypothetical protein